MITIVPADLHADHADLARSLAAGVSAAHPTEQAAVALLLRLPFSLFARLDLARHYTADPAYPAVVDWRGLAYAAENGDLPLSRGERQMILAACAIGSPLVTAPLHQIVTCVDARNLELLTEAMWWASGRPDGAR